MNNIDMALIFKALADCNRLQIVELLSESGELCACKILERFEITQPTLSHHMNVLCECGLVDACKEGRWSYYSLNKETLQAVQKHVISWRPTEGNVRCVCQ